MKQYEFIHVHLHESDKTKSVWEVDSGESLRYIEVAIGKNRNMDALVCVMNMLGKEGWSLGSKETHSYSMYMQRETDHSYMSVSDVEKHYQSKELN